MSDEKNNDEKSEVSAGAQNADQQQVPPEETDNSDEVASASDDSVTDDLTTEQGNIAESDSLSEASDAEPDSTEEHRLDELDTSDWSSAENLGPLEIEGGATTGDGSIALKINGVEVGPLTRIDRTLSKTNEQIEKAKSLIFITGGIGAFVLIFSIFFFVLMSVQLSTKTDELDQMLIALGKRGIQLGDGIEELTEIEKEMIEMRGVHSLLVSDISMLKASNEELLSDLESTIMSLERSTRDLQTELVEIKKETQSVRNAVGVGLTQAQEQIVGEFADSSRGYAILSGRVSDLSSEQSKLSSKLDDLYLIQRAALEGRLNLE